MNVALAIIAMFVLPLLAVLIPIQIGQYIGARHRKKVGELEDGPIGTSVGAALGLLAFLMAFTFQIVSERVDSRRELLLAEVTEIRTAYLQAGLIPEPYKSESRKLLMEYTNIRVELAADVSKVHSVIARSQQIVDSLWTFSEALSAINNSSESYSLFTGSVSELVGLFNQRVTMVMDYRVPQLILEVLLAVGVLSMLALGYQFGATGKGNTTAKMLTAVIFAIVMWLIFAMDRPEYGLIRPTQSPVYKLQQQLMERQAHNR